MTQPFYPLPYQPYGGPPPAGKGVSGFGIAALVLGIVALVFSWIPLCGLAAMPLAGIGLLLAIVGVIVSLAGGRSKLGMSVTGGIVCLLAVGIQVAVTGGLMAMGAKAAKQQAEEDARRPATQPTTQADAGFTIVSYGPSSADLSTLLAEESKKAEALGRKPFVEFYADWCKPCKALADSLSDPLMIDAFKGTYIIRLNADDWQSKLSAASLSASTIPVFYELSDEGKPTGRSIDGGAWEENIPANMAPPLKKFFNVE